MWTVKGRSGIGDANIQCTWEDWDGLSPNGRQYKNAITQETRNLSGQEYWNARKADYPGQELEVWKNGVANVKAYAEQYTNKNKTKPPSAFDKVCSADKAYERLMTLSDQLDEQLNDEEISFSDWTYARKQIDKKLDNAWQKLCSLRGWDAGEKDDEIFTNMLNDKVKQYRTASEQKTKQASSVSGVFSEAMYGLKDENVFKKLYVWWRGYSGGDRSLLSPTVDR